MHNTKYLTTKRTSIISGTINTVLALLKIVFGIMGRSQALIADGLHSLSDVVCDGLVLIAAKISQRAPDIDHPYGHRRIETIASIVIALMLIAIGAMIIIESVNHIIAHATLPKPAWIVLMVAFISMMANESLFHYCRYKAKQINSNLLHTNAWHNRSDALSSLVVLIAAGSAHFGVTWMDPVGGIIISILIVYMGGKMGYQGLNELIDAAVDTEMLATITDIITQEPGVVAAHQIRTRLHSGSIFVDCHILVEPMLSVSEGHFIGDHVKYQLIKQCKDIADVTVHIDAEDDNDTTTSFHLPTRDELLKKLDITWKNLPGYQQISTITLHYLDEKIILQATLPLALLNNHDPNELQQQYQKRSNSLPYKVETQLLFSN